MRLRPDSQTLPWIIAACLGLLFAVQMQLLLNGARDAPKNALDDIGEAASGLAQRAEAAAKDILTPGDQESTPPGPVGVIDTISGGIGDALEIADLLGDRIIGLSHTEEIDLGKSFHRDLTTDPATVVSVDAKVVAWLHDLMRPLLELRSETAQMDYTLTLLESDSVNAFSHVGGYVYVCRGILEAMEYDPRAVQFVLGHEIAHIELRQCARRAYAQRRAEEIAGPLAGTIGGAAHRSLQVNYSQKDELACDAWSFRAMRSIGLSKQESLRSTRRMVQLEENANSAHEDPTNALEAIGNAVTSHFCTHPTAEARLAHLEVLDD